MNTRPRPDAVGVGRERRRTVFPVDPGHHGTNGPRMTLEPFRATVWIYLLLWQDAGRSAAWPVHWPLWPAPLPPLVGGDGLLKAGLTEPIVTPAATTTATMILFT
jgi:hypothetical protein